MMASAEELKGLGNAALQAGAFADAVRHYTGAISLDPSNHIYFSNRSAAHLSAGNAEAAVADGEACVELKPDWPKAHSRVGAALHKLGRLGDAVGAFTRGLELCPGDAGLATGLKAAAAALDARGAKEPPVGADASSAAATPPATVAASSESSEAANSGTAGGEWKEQSERWGPALLNARCSSACVLIGSRRRRLHIYMPLRSR